MSALNEDRKSGPGIRTKLNTVRDRAMAVGEVAERGAGKAQFAQRRTEVQPDESKPEGDAVDAVEDAGQELADDAEHIGKSFVHRIGDIVHKGRKSEQKQDDGEGIQKEGVDGGEHADTSTESPIEIKRDDEAAAGLQEDLCQPKASNKDIPQTAQPCANESESPDSSLQGTGKKDSTAVSESSGESISDAPVSETPAVNKPAADAPTPDEEAPRRSRQNRSRLKRKEALTADGTPQPDKTGIGASDDAPLSAPRSRLLSPEELESASARSIENPHLSDSTATSTEGPAGLDTKANMPDMASNAPDDSPAPRVHRPQSDLCHERPTPQAPRQREILREPVASARVVESQPRIEIRTADIDAKIAGKAGSAAGNAAMNSAANAYANAAADAAKQKAAEETSNRIASHMKELSKRAAERMMRALKQSGRAGLRATETAAKALVETLTAGSGVVVVVILVILMCASILASPFGIFTHSDGIEDPGSYTLEKAISDINDEYVTAVQRKTSGHKNVTIVIEGNIEEEIEPVNWVDVLGVFSVHVTMRAQNAMNIVDLGEAQLRELRNVFWDMNTLTVERETEDGDTTTYVVGHALTYRDMVEKYHFTEQQVELLNEIMSDEYYAFWSNFVSASMGYGDIDWTGVTSSGDDPSGGSTVGYTPTFSGGSMRIPAIYQYNYKKTVCVIDGKNKSASTSGCGAASMCMVIHYLTGNTKPTPYTLFKWAYDNGYYDGNGLDHSAVSAMGRLCGVTGTWIGKDGKKIVKALMSGHPVIAHMGPGIFTKQGHYIVLRGVTKEGKILVNDPASSSRTGKAYPLSTIVSQGKTDTPFMVCSKKSN